jgi:hypothetical protein
MQLQWQVEIAPNARDNFDKDSWMGNGVDTA